ncbi:DUF302 domain-containing protein [Sphingomonas sp. PB4P5]|uniref:DUF302 domain-containing protein n=1 Tax=Parasphingomonas puruogangriensis TaxID=3096155 RepID=UPI002FCB9B1E
MIEGLNTRASGHGWVETVRRVLLALDRRGLHVFARIDHRAAAEAAGLTLPPTEVVVFGDPRAGTPLMGLARTMAIDLPLRILVWEDHEGATWLSCDEPSWLGRRHGLEVDAAEVLERMDQSVAAIVAEAAETGPR